MNETKAVMILHNSFWDLYHEVYSPNEFDNIGGLIDDVSNCAESLKLNNLSVIDKYLKAIDGGLKSEQQNAVESIYSLINSNNDDLLN